MLAAVERYILERKRPVTAKQIAAYFLTSPRYVNELCRILAKETIKVTKKNGRNYYSKRD